MYCCRRKTSVLLYRSSCPFSRGQLYVAVTEVAYDEAHTAAKIFDTDCEPTSVNMVLDIKFRTI